MIFMDEQLILKKMLFHSRKPTTSGLAHVLEDAGNTHAMTLKKDSGVLQDLKVNLTTGIKVQLHGLN